MKKSTKFAWAFGVVGVLVALGFATGMIKLGVRTGNFEQDKQLAYDAVEQFHARMDSNQFPTIYNETHPLMQKQLNQATLVAALTRTRTITGKVISTTPVAANTFPGGQVRLVYNTKFEKKNASEWFSWQSDGSSARLLLYQVRPGFAPASTNFTP